METPNQNLPSSSPPTSNWVRGSCIGKGSFGTVNQAINKSNNRVFAVKSVDLKMSPSTHVEALENEIQILKTLSSPYVVKYLGDDVTSDMNRNLHIEYMSEGTLADGCSGKGAKLDERVIRSYIKCVLTGLHYIHSQGVVHCDVKGKNVLLGSSPGVAKLADFGSAKRMTDSGKPRGTPLWMAPEVIRQENQGPESDVWSLGCTMIEMITGKPGWDNQDVTMVFQIGFCDEIPKFPAQLSELGRDFLEKCLRRKPSERWTCEQLLRHPFVSINSGVEPSPRSVLDWSNSEENFDSSSSSCNSSFSSENSANSAKGRIAKLACPAGLIWESEGWEVVRSAFDKDDRRENQRREESHEGTSLVCSVFVSDEVESKRVNLKFYNYCGGSGCGCSCGCSSSCGCKAGLECRYGLKDRWIEEELEKGKKAGYSCWWCKLFLILLMILIDLSMLRFDVNERLLFGSEFRQRAFANCFYIVYVNFAITFINTLCHVSLVRCSL